MLTNQTTVLNKYSKVFTQDKTQPAAQAMLYGIGLTDDDMQKAQIGIGSMGYDGNTCNMHLNDLAQIVKESVWGNDLVGLVFNTIGVSDGMSNGTDGAGKPGHHCRQHRSDLWWPILRRRHHHSWM